MQTDSAAFFPFPTPQLDIRPGTLYIPGIMTDLLLYHSPVGALLLSAEEDFITGLRFVAAGTASASSPSRRSRPLALAADFLDRHFAGESLSPLELPLNPSGTPFQRMIWRLLCQIPRGETLSYGRLAARAAGISGRTVSPRAVGGAAGANPIPVIIPCHRLVAARGIGGFSSGLPLKIALLELEGVPCSMPRQPGGSAFGGNGLFSEK